MCPVPPRKLPTGDGAGFALDSVLLSQVVGCFAGAQKECGEGPFLQKSPSPHPTPMDFQLI